MRRDRDEQLRIGHEIAVARDVYNTPWKVLMDRYGYGRTRLYQLYRRAVADHKSVHEHHQRRQAGAA